MIKALELMQFNNVSVECQEELNGQSNLNKSFNHLPLLIGHVIVYRELGKNAETKSKKTGAASTSTASKKTAGGAGSASSASAKGKGKERAVPAVPLPPPFTSAPLPLGGEKEAEQDLQPPADPESISAAEPEEYYEEWPMDIWETPVSEDDAPPIGESDNRDDANEPIA